MKTFPLSNFFDPFPVSVREDYAAVRNLLAGEYGARIFAVGGAVRDRLLGRRVEDLDLEVYGLSLERFEEAMGRLGAQGVGRSFFVYKYGSLDIALPRRERKTAPGHRGFAVEIESDLEVASRRRDFTINALMYDFESETVLDYWGGLEDLQMRRLRRIDPESFVEDSLRVLRAMRFAAQLGFRVEEATCRLCREISLEDLPGSRIWGEFERIFLSGNPHYGLFELLRLGIAERLWGEEMGRNAFIAAAREMIRFRQAAPEALRPWCFLEAYRRHTTAEISTILEAIDAPNRWRRAFEALPPVPAEPTLRFVAKQCPKRGLKKSPLGCDPRLRALAREIDVWERPFEIGVTPRELMERGFSGKALGEELERYRRLRLLGLERERLEGVEG